MKLPIMSLFSPLRRRQGKLTISAHRTAMPPVSSVMNAKPALRWTELPILVDPAEPAAGAATPFVLHRSGKLLALEQHAETGSPILSISAADLHVPIKPGTRKHAIEEMLIDLVTEDVARVPRTLGPCKGLFVTPLSRIVNRPRRLISAALAVQMLLMKHPPAPSPRSAIVGFTLGNDRSQLVVLWELTPDGQLRAMEATPRTADVEGTIKSFASSRRITSTEEFQQAFELLTITLFDTHDLFDILPRLTPYSRPGDWFGISRNRLLTLMTPYVSGIAAAMLAVTGYQAYQLTQLQHMQQALPLEQSIRAQFQQLVTSHAPDLLRAASIRLDRAIATARAVAPPAGTVDIAMNADGIHLTTHRKLPTVPGLAFPAPIPPPKECRQEKFQLSLTELKVTYACKNLATDPLAVLYRSLH